MTHMFYKRHKMHKRKSFFPFVIALLTLLLLILIIIAFPSKDQQRVTEPMPTTSSPVVNDEVDKITVDGYMQDLSSVIGPFMIEFRQTDNQIQQLKLIENALSSVLAIRVPSEYQGVHLEIASALNLMSDGLQGNRNIYDQGLTRLNQVVAENPWLR